MGTTSAPAKDQQSVAASTAVVNQQNVATTSTAAEDQQLVSTRSTRTEEQQSGAKNTRHPDTRIKKRNCEEIILDFLKTEPKQPKQIKRRRIISNCEIITADEYFKKKEQEEKVKGEGLQQKNVKLLPKVNKSL